MKYLINYYWVQGDHLFATPKLHHSEIVECDSAERLQEYIEGQKDGWGHKYKKESKFGYDYISNQGGVKVKIYKPEVIKIPKIKKI